MTIAEVREKCKKRIALVPRDVLIFGVLIGASLLSFGLGYLAGVDAKGSATVEIERAPIDISRDEQVVASRSGTKYYFPWCAGADRITEANKVWFASAGEASLAGYAPAANCSGL